MIDISVVIPVYNAVRTIEDCLYALSLQSFENFEVIIVDNNSSDDSMVLVERFRRGHRSMKVLVEKESRQGACFARNTGWRRSAGEIIANIDPDCIASRDWLADIAKKFSDNQVSALAGNIKSFSNENIYELFSTSYTLLGRHEDEFFGAYTLTRGGFATANLSIRSSWMERLGGFDETINYHGIGIGEDHDLLARLYAHGGKLLATKDALIFHWHRSSLKSLTRQAYLFGLAQALLTRKHGGQNILITTGRREYRIGRCRSAWIDLSGLDKKVAALAAFGLVWPFGAILMLGGYFGLQVVKVIQRLVSSGQSINVKTAASMVLILACKCTAMSAGRLHGSAKFKLVCI